MVIPRYLLIIKIVATCVLTIVTSSSGLPLVKTPASPATVILHQRDPLNTMSVAAYLPLGQLAYMVNVLPVGPLRPLIYDLVLRTTGKGSGEKSEAIYQFVTDDENLLFQMDWSPDGKYLLLKEGDAYDYTSTYRLYLWNALQQRVQAGPAQDLSNPNIGWSPGSRFISYIEGGDTNGFEAHGAGPLRLYTYDLEKKRSYFLVQNPAVASHIWTRQGTVLCTIIPPFDPNHPSPDAQRKSIYELPVRGGTPIKLIDHGSDPMPSPDGHWIAFYGWPDPHDQAERQKKAAANHQALSYLPGMYLFDRRTGKRTLLREAVPGTSSDNIAWSADSKTIYMVWNNYISTLPRIMSTADQKVYSGQGVGHVYVINVPHLVKREVVALTAADINSRIDTTGQFLIKGVSADKRYLFLQVSRIGNQLPGPPYYDRFLELDAIDLQNGSHQIVWATKNAEALDWHLSQ